MYPLKYENADKKTFRDLNYDQMAQQAVLSYSSIACIHQAYFSLGLLILYDSKSIVNSSHLVFPDRGVVWSRHPSDLRSGSTRLPQGDRPT